jgi:hypothetical protein
LERHGAEGVGKRLLIPASAIPGYLAWRRNRCGLLEQWLWLSLPGHESRGSVGNRHGQVGLWALLSYRNEARVHGDMPLPRVDVRRPQRSGPTISAGGSSGGHSGVARVTTTAATIAIIPATIDATITAIATIVVLILDVVVVGWTGWRGNLFLGSRRRSAGVEHRRSSRWSDGVQVNLLQQEVIPNFKEFWERRGMLDDGHKVFEALVEATEDVEDEDSVVDRRP